MITIEQDFENEIAFAKSWPSDYPYINLVAENTEYRRVLFEQFKNA